MTLIGTSLSCKHEYSFIEIAQASVSQDGNQAQTTRPPQVARASGTHVTATVRFSVAPHFGQRSGDCLFNNTVEAVIQNGDQGYNPA